MILQNNPPTLVRPAPLIVSRTFPYPREKVFEVWTKAEHFKNWFSPESCSVPEAEIDFRPGGIFKLCMRVPGEPGHWCIGNFGEIIPLEKIVIDMNLIVGNIKRFRALTTVTFANEGNNAKMTVHQAYEIFDEEFMHAVEGATEGWRTTLDKMERELARI